MSNAGRQFNQLLRDAPRPYDCPGITWKKAAFEIYLQNATAIAIGKRTPHGCAQRNGGQQPGVIATGAGRDGLIRPALPMKERRLYGRSDL